MENYLKAIQITEKVWWVGAIDWNLREFHGYRTARGSTYNAYLVVADKITLIDTVKAPFKDEMMQRIASVIGDPARIDYIISNHAEMDHSGAAMPTRSLGSLRPPSTAGNAQMPIFSSNSGASARIRLTKVLESSIIAV